MRTALLIIDVQNGILAGTASGERQAAIDGAFDSTVERLSSLKGRAHAQGIPVILVRHDDGPGQILAAGSEGWALRPEIAPDGGDTVIDKTSCDSFYRTDLQSTLANLGISRLVIGGCMTQFCVDTACRRAVSLGFDVTLISDGHMTSDWGALTYDQIIDHHNRVLNGFTAGLHSIQLAKAENVKF